MGIGTSRRGGGERRESRGAKYEQHKYENKIMKPMKMILKGERG